MRDLEDGDELGHDAITGKPFVRRVRGDCMSVEPLAWSGLRDYAEWWLRQERLRPDIKLSAKDRKVFESILQEVR